MFWSQSKKRSSSTFPCGNLCTLKDKLLSDRSCLNSAFQYPFSCTTLLSPVTVASLVLPLAVFLIWEFSGIPLSRFQSRLQLHVQFGQTQIWGPSGEAHLRCVLVLVDVCSLALQAAAFRRRTTRNVWLFPVLTLWLGFSLRRNGDDSGETWFTFCWAHAALALAHLALAVTTRPEMIWWWLTLAHQSLCCREKPRRGWDGTLSLVWSIQVQSSRRGLSPAEVAQVESNPSSWCRCNSAVICNLDKNTTHFQKKKTKKHAVGLTGVSSSMINPNDVRVTL